MTDSQPKCQNPIRSLSEYLQRIVDITSKERKDHSKALFYRGHADSSWKLEPAVYRTDQNGKSYRDVELQMYQAMLRRSPQAFQDCKTTFERLVKMQHYGLPTRLLDLTQSPLVALYFACREKNEKDGEVFVIKAEKKDVYFQENLPSNAFFEFDFQYLLKDVLRYISHQYVDEIDYICQVAQSLGTDKTEFKEYIDKKMRELLDSFQTYKLAEGEEDLCNYATEFICKYHAFSREIIEKDEITYFATRCYNMDNKIFQNISARYNINTSNVRSMITFLISYSEECIIYPPLNNERIQKQQGVFICFPRYHFRKKELNFSTEQITIAGNKKTAILDELKTMGITQAYLFPELDVQANDIKNNIYTPA